MFKRLVRVACAGCLLYGAFVLLLAGCQRHLIYYPSTAPEDRMLEVARAEGLDPWRDAAGSLIGWRTREGPENAWTVLVFHGNAGHALHRGYFAQGFTELGPWEVRVFEYPGYGAREGRPSATAFKHAAAAAFRELRAESPEGILLVGESIGTGVAAHLAGEFSEEVDGLLLITPFTRLEEVARRHYPFLPVGLLLRERYDNEAALADYTGPLAVILAEDDTIIPADIGRALYDSYAGPKALWVQEGRGHNTLDYTSRASWWREVSAFLRSETVDQPSE